MYTLEYLTKIYPDIFFDIPDTAERIIFEYIRSTRIPFSLMMFWLKHDPPSRLWLHRHAQDSQYAKLHPKPAGNPPHSEATREESTQSEATHGESSHGASSQDDLAGLLDFLKTLSHHRLFFALALAEQAAYCNILTVRAQHVSNNTEHRAELAWHEIVCRAEHHLQELRGIESKQGLNLHYTNQLSMELEQHDPDSPALWGTLDEIDNALRSSSRRKLLDNLRAGAGALAHHLYSDTGFATDQTACTRVNHRDGQTVTTASGCGFSRGLRFYDRCRANTTEKTFANRSLCCEYHRRPFKALTDSDSVRFYRYLHAIWPWRGLNYPSFTAYRDCTVIDWGWAASDRFSVNVDDSMVVQSVRRPIQYPVNARIFGKTEEFRQVDLLPEYSADTGRIGRQKTIEPAARQDKDASVIFWPKERKTLLEEESDVVNAMLGTSKFRGSTFVDFFSRLTSLKSGGTSLVTNSSYASLETFMSHHIDTRFVGSTKAHAVRELPRQAQSTFVQACARLQQRALRATRQLSHGPLRLGRPNQFAFYIVPEKSVATMMTFAAGFALICFVSGGALVDAIAYANDLSSEKARNILGQNQGPWIVRIWTDPLGVVKSLSTAAEDTLGIKMLTKKEGETGAFEVASGLLFATSVAILSFALGSSNRDVLRRTLRPLFNTAFAAMIGAWVALGTAFFVHQYSTVAGDVDDDPCVACMRLGVSALWLVISVGLWSFFVWNFRKMMFVTRPFRSS